MNHRGGCVCLLREREGVVAAQLLLPMAMNEADDDAAGYFVWGEGVFAFPSSGCAGLIY